jgi:hypothetical protein
MESRNLIERLENIIAFLNAAQDSMSDNYDGPLEPYSEIENALGIAGEILTMIDGR